MSLTKATQNVIAPITATGSTTPRLLQDRFADVVNVKDFGARGDGVTDDTAAFQAAYNYASANQTIFIPNGNYLCSAITGTSKLITWIVDGEIVNSSISEWDQVLPSVVSITGSKDGQGGEINFSKLSISDSFQCATGQRANGFLVYQTVNSGAKGIRQALTGQLVHQNPSSSISSDKFYVGVQSNCTSVNGDGGTSLTPAGAYFGVNGYCELLSGATYVENATAAEFNTVCNTGSSVNYRSGIQIAGGGSVQGSTVDSAIVISNLTGGSAWKKGILIGNYNGANALGTSSTAIEINEGTIQNGIQFGSTSVTGSYLVGNNLNLQNGTAQFTASNQLIYVGNRTASNTPVIYLFSSGSTGPDANISVTGGTGSNDGSLTIAASQFVPNGIVRSSTDNTKSLGTASFRWSVVYAGTGTINTSDEREKQQIRSLSDSEKTVAIKLKGLIKAFKFNDAVEKKGDGARIHFGVIAQEVKSAFEAEGLVAEKYAVLCYDEWDAQEEVKDSEGNVIQPACEAGNRYGVRYDELFAFIISQL